MSIYLSHMSAFYYWLYSEPEPNTQLKHCLRKRRLRSPESLPLDHIPKTSSSSMQFLKALFASKGYMDICVPNALARRKGDGASFHCHVMPPDECGESFIKIHDELYVACPELCLAQIASSKNASLVSMAVKCSELMAAYCVLSKTEEIELVRRTPLTDKESILSFLRNHQGLRGANLLERACNLSVGPCASPAEIPLGLFLTAPLRNGGLSIKKCQFNHVVDTSSYYHSATKHTRICDIFLPDLNIDLEYHGAIHSSMEQLNLDAIRTAELSSIGINIIYLTRDILVSPEKLEIFARKTLGEKGGFGSLCDKGLA